ncbi:MAG: RNA ligase family protein [Pirellulales bacterium]
MGTSYGEFIKFPKTPHLFGSVGTADDTQLNERESAQFLANESLIVEEKIDGANVGIHFSDDGKLILQCRGHLLTEGMHPQFDPFKQWAAAKQHVFKQFLQNRFLMFGEWVYARHTIQYRSLPHYFLAFDIYDKDQQVFLDHERRSDIFGKLSVHMVPILRMGSIRCAQLNELITTSKFAGQIESSSRKYGGKLMEGLYLRTESDGVVTERAKYVRREFVVKRDQNSGWRHQAMVMNLLAPEADVWM